MASQTNLPTDIDLLKQVEQALARTPGTWAIDVLLHASMETAQQLIPPGMATLEQTPEGVRLHCYVQSLDWFAHFLAGLDCPWRVNHPPELRQALHNLAARITALTP